MKENNVCIWCALHIHSHCFHRCINETYHFLNSLQFVVFICVRSFDVNEMNMLFLHLCHSNARLQLQLYSCVAHSFLYSIFQLISLSDEIYVTSSPDTQFASNRFSFMERNSSSAFAFSIHDSWSKQWCSYCVYCTLYTIHTVSTLTQYWHKREDNLIFCI